ncbi:MAG: DUF2339 domain-containing protein, partial [Patescibacteria group bacterium]
MTDKIVELLQGLRSDVGELKTDVHKLSQKVDHISNNSKNNVQEQKEVFSAAASDISNNSEIKNENEVSYGRKLSSSEQEYIDKLHSSDVKQKATTPGEPPAPPAPVRTKPTETRVHEKSIVEIFFVWLAKDWPMKIGGFFVIAAVGWFVTWAAKEGILSENMRVVLGYVFAVGCIAFGAMRAEKNHTQGNVFLVIGMGAMFISTLAGINFEIISQVVGLFVMLASVGLVTLVSLKQKRIALTSSMIFFGAIIPLFFFDDIGIDTIFVYLFMLTLGTLWVVSLTAWRGLTTLMLGVVAFYSIGYIVSSFSSDLESLKNIIIAFLFAATFYTANVASIVRSEKSSGYDLTTAIGIGVLFLIWMMNFASEEHQVFLILMGVLSFAIASYMIFVKIEHKAPTIVYGGVSAMLFAVATALQFDGPILVTAYLVEAAAVVIIMTYFAGRAINSRLRAFLVLLYILPVLMSLFYVAQIFDFLSYDQVGNIEDMLSPLFAVFIACVSAFTVAISVLRLVDVSNKENMTFFRYFAYIGGVFALLLVWFVTHLFMKNYDVATFVSL